MYPDSSSPDSASDKVDLATTMCRASLGLRNRLAGIEVGRYRTVTLRKLVRRSPGILMPRVARQVDPRIRGLHPKECFFEIHSRSVGAAAIVRQNERLDHDFVIPELGRATPYGIDDLTHNHGWVSVGIDHDTAAFAVETIRRWWTSMGQSLYPAAQRLLITAVGGGNGSRVRLWKIELQKLADRMGLRIAVCHLPPGTCKWN